MQHFAHTSAAFRPLSHLSRSLWNLILSLKYLQFLPSLMHFVVLRKFSECTWVYNPALFSWRALAFMGMNERFEAQLSSYGCCLRCLFSEAPLRSGFQGIQTRLWNAILWEGLNFTTVEFKDSAHMTPSVHYLRNSKNILPSVLIDRENFKLCREKTSKAFSSLNIRTPKTLKTTSAGRNWIHCLILGSRWKLIASLKRSGRRLTPLPMGTV